MESMQLKAIEALEIDSDKQLVKCQGCGTLWPISPDNSTHCRPSDSGRIYQLERRIKYIKKYGIGNRQDCKQEEQVSKIQ